jgi:AraC-like DNA-binding protein
MALKSTIRGSAGCVEPTVPAVYALHLADGVQLCGGSRLQLMTEFGLSDDVFSEPERRIAFHDGLTLLERALQLTGMPPMLFAFALGALAPISRFGNVGFAVMTCATLRDAIETSARFAPIVTAVCRFRLHVAGDRAYIELTEAVPFGPAREFIIPLLMRVYGGIGERLSGVPLQGDVEFAFPEPAYLANISFDKPGSMRFDQPCHRICFDAAFLDLPLTTADPAAVRAARQLCERQLSELEPSEQLVDRVRALLFASEPRGINGPAVVARSLGMSERTLKRKLAEQGTSYSDLLERERQRQAIELLRGAASIEQVAEHLGYSDAANFTRAFRRWTGRSPRTFRTGC